MVHSLPTFEESLEDDRSDVDVAITEDNAFAIVDFGHQLLDLASINTFAKNALGLQIVWLRQKVHANVHDWRDNLAVVVQADPFQGSTELLSGQF